MPRSPTAAAPVAPHGSARIAIKRPSAREKRRPPERGSLAVGAPLPWLDRGDVAADEVAAAVLEPPDLDDRMRPQATVVPTRDETRQHDGLLPSLQHVIDLEPGALQVTGVTWGGRREVLRSREGRHAQSQCRPATLAGRSSARTIGSPVSARPFG